MFCCGVCVRAQRLHDGADRWPVCELQIRSQLFGESFLSFLRIVLHTGVTSSSNGGFDEALLARFAVACTGEYGNWRVGTTVLLRRNRASCGFCCEEVDHLRGCGWITLHSIHKEMCRRLLWRCCVHLCGWRGSMPTARLLFRSQGQPAEF